jgi:glucose-1-phosphate adenylyltransferase
VEISTNIIVMRRSYLLGLIHRASVYGYRHLYTDVIAREMERSNFRVYRMDGFYARLDTLKNYFQTSMRLLNPADRKDLFGQKGNAIYTKVRNSAPTKFADGAKVSNSLLADGCVIEGTVENSILFRGVKVGKGSVVRNSILLQDTYTGSGVSLNYVVTDKDVLIKDGRTLSGCEQLPFYLSKGTVV